MKKVFLAISTILFILISTYTFQSCKKEKGICKSCETNSSVQNFVVLNKLISVKGYGDYLSNQTSCYSDFNSKELDFYSILSELGLSEEFQLEKQNIVSLNLFVRSSTNLTKRINKEDILSMFVYIRNGDVMKTKYFIQKESSFIIFDRFNNTKSFILSASDMYAIGKQTLSGKLNWSIFSLRNSELLPKIKKEELAFSELQYTIKATHFELDKRAPIGGSTSCNGPCYTGPPHTFCWVDPWTSQYECSDGKIGDGPICVGKIVQDVLNNAEEETSSLLDAFVTIYRFRDDFLLSYYSGRQYVNDYYFVSWKMNELSLSECIDAKEILINVITPIAEKLLDADDDTIVYTSTEKELLIDYVNHLIDLNSDENIIAILNKFKGDINKYCNQTAYFIRNDLE